MSAFDWKKDFEDSIKDGVIITVTTTGLFFALKAAGMNLPKAAFDAMDVMKLGAGICAGVLVKEYMRRSIGEGLCSL